MQSMSKRFVVIGASAASIAFITKLRSFDKESEIICLSGEADIPYNRCFLADYVSQDKTIDDMQLKSDDFFEQNKIDLRLSTWVTKIDTQNNCVFVGTEQITYDNLFIGIGCRPFVPNVGINRAATQGVSTQGVSTRGVFTFHTADDVKRLVSYVQEHKPLNVIVIGGGLNGVECASALRDNGVAVGLIERDKQVLPLQFDDSGAKWLTAVMQHKGVGLFLGQSVSQVCTVNGKVEAVKLQTGAQVLTDCVVFATGSVVNSELLEGTGIVTERGSIIVDAHMKTSIHNVYAGGDVCIVKDAVGGQQVQSTTWADAMLQGLCAATQFSERQRKYPGFVGLRDSKFFGYDFYACGKTVGHDETIKVVHRIEDEAFKAFYLHGECLVGFILLGDISRVAEYKRMYLTKQCVKERELI